MNAEGLIRRGRERKGLDQKALARAAGVSPGSVSSAETARNPSIALLERYGVAMGYKLAVAYIDADGTIIY